MRKIALIGILIGISVLTNAQNYFISFSASGDTNQIGTIQVVNLTTLDTVWLNGSDTLNLIGWGVGLENQRTENCDITLSPNPVLNDAILSVQSNREGSAVISVHDMSGKIITSKEEQVNPGETQFRLSGFPKGSYIVRVNGKEIHGSVKMISDGIANRPTIDEVTNYMDYKSFKSQKFEKNTTTTQVVQMTYTTGDRLQYRGQTSNYRKIVVDVPNSSKNQDFHFLTCFDNYGHSYETVDLQISYKKKSSNLDTTYTQTWMAENLNAGEFRTEAQGFHNDTVIEKFCYYDSISNCNEYGGLYRWDEMMGYQLEDSVQGICPDGWRIPTEEEYQNLINSYGGAPFIIGVMSGDSIAGGKMKEVGTIHWNNGYDPLYPPCENPDATNESGFTAIAGGGWATEIGMYNTHWGSKFTDAVFWTSTSYPFYPGCSYEWSMECINGIAWNCGCLRTDAYSVRCVHD